jgi:hypothetical protein
MAITPSFGRTPPNRFVENFHGIVSALSGEHTRRGEIMVGTLIGARPRIVKAREITEHWRKRRGRA